MRWTNYWLSSLALTAAVGCGGSEGGTTLAPAGTVLTARADNRVSSRAQRAGETITATVSNAVTDADGTVLVPQGARVTFRIEDIAPAENKSEADGRLSLLPVELQVAGKSYPLVGKVASVEHHLEGRGVTAGDAAKAGAGVAAGAVAGRVVGGNSKTAVIGGVVGGAVGTAAAIETADRDVVIPAGGKITVRLTSALRLEPS